MPVEYCLLKIIQDDYCVHCANDSFDTVQAVNPANMSGGGQNIPSKAANYKYAGSAIAQLKLCRHDAEESEEKQRREDFACEPRRLQQNVKQEGRLAPKTPQYECHFGEKDKTLQSTLTDKFTYELI